MAFELKIPLDVGGDLDVAMSDGEVIFVLGANGTGKSSLIQRFASATPGSVKRISAQRQNWFAEGAVGNLSAAQRVSLEKKYSWLRQAGYRAAS